MDILKSLKTILNQPYWVIVFIVGALMVALPCVSFDKDHAITTHNPQSWFLVAAGGVLILLSLVAFSLNLVLEFHANRSLAVEASASSGLDTSCVEERGGVFSTKVGDCEIRVTFGRLEDYHPMEEAVFVLPCNEYFDHSCVNDLKGALGAYVNRAFAGRAAEFAQVVEVLCRQRLGKSESRCKAADEKGLSFGPGRAILLQNALNTNQAVALVSTTTQRVGEGLVGRISYLFAAMSELIKCLAETPRLREAVMPLLGSGHGGINAPLALVGLLLALAEVVRYGPGAQRLKRVTIVVFRRDEHAKPEVDPTVVRRALALIARQA